MASSVVSPELAAEMSLLHTYQMGTEIGTILSSVCFGIFCVQLYTFTHTSATRNEPRWILCFVAVVAGLEFAHTLLLWIFMVDATSRFLEDPFYYALDTPVINAVLCITGIIGAVVQSYYAYRIYRFSGHIWFSLPVWAGSLARASLTLYGACSAAIQIKARSKFSIFDFKEEFGWVFKGTLGASVATDVLSTIFLCSVLAKHRTGMGVFIVDKLIIWTVETGMLTSCIAVSLLAIIILGRYELLPGLYHIYPNMFSLSLLFSLNSREGFRRALQTKPIIGTSASRSVSDLGPMSPRTRTLWGQRSNFPNDMSSQASNTFKLDDLSHDQPFRNKVEGPAGLKTGTV